MTIQEIEQLDNFSLLKEVYKKVGDWLTKVCLPYEIGNSNIIMDIIFRILKVESLYIYWSNGGWEVWLDEEYTSHHAIQNVALLRAILMMINGKGI
jgi:hypothetical protein